MEQAGDSGERHPLDLGWRDASSCWSPASALIAPRSAAADCPGAEAFIESADQQTVGILNAKDTDDARRLQQMADLMFEVADLSLIARLVLGRHWRSASEAQRTAYLDAFRIYALDSLAYRFARLGGGVDFKPTRPLRRRRPTTPRSEPRRGCPDSTGSGAHRLAHA